VTDDAFSLHPAQVVTDAKQFNAPFDNSSPWDRETRKQMTGIGTDEYVKPETLFLDMETLRDVTANEFRYVLGNILRSSRYGAISSRIGKVKNTLAGVILSDCEVFSNLELTQTVYDLLRNGATEPDFPASSSAVIEAVQQATETLSKRVVGQLTSLPAVEITALIEEMATLYNDDEAVTKMLETTTRMYRPQA
jgi:CRISPR-associated protein Csc2